VVLRWSSFRNLVDAVRASNRRSLLRHALVVIALDALSAGELRAQAGERGVVVSAGATAIPLLSWVDRTAGDRTLAEAYVTQPVAMGSVEYGGVSALGTVDLEGLTLRRGELTPGAWGEGYVDRRHPHAYIHEALLGVAGRVEAASMSLFAGRGFAPFGSDDPMSRPFVKYPVNHHLAQVLERVVVIGAVNLGPLTGELATFNGDEPVGPARSPQWRRFGDSWSTRITWRPERTIELSYSHADVKSPESPLGGTFDDRKNHASLRMVPSSGIVSYALVEWGRTDEYSRGRRAFRYQSFLSEGELCMRAVTTAFRLELASRPEEERLESVFRTVRPTTDVSILGVSNWTTITANIATRSLALRALRAVPFVEGSFAHVAHGSPAGLVDLTQLYGARRTWMLSTGARLRIGHVHDRMGRYGAARSTLEMHDESGTHSHESSTERTCSR